MLENFTKKLFLLQEHYVGKTVVITEERDPCVVRYNGVVIKAVNEVLLEDDLEPVLFTNRGLFRLNEVEVQEGILMGPHFSTLKTDHGLFLLGI